MRKHLLLSLAAAAAMFVIEPAHAQTFALPGAVSPAAPAAPSAPPRPAPSAAAARSERRVVEYALHENLPGGERQGLFSDTHLELVRAVQAHYALAGKRDTSITRRECVYPLDSRGRVSHAASTVNETEVE